jgi:UDP-N-acetylmuramate--alanine ligase
MNLNDTQNIYFVGIGGIGMSAIARYFKANGKNVAGYDKYSSDNSKDMEASGIKIHYSDDLNLIDEEFKNKNETLVVYTPAIPKTHSELTFFNEQGFTVLKRSEILGMITKNSKCLAVSGTHGKTSTSSILGHIMHECGTNATSFLGGITENYNSNLILGGIEVSVVEADEYDRSFLRLSPDIACINSMDPDHLDIYGNAEEFTATFRKFASMVSDTLLVKKGLPIKGLTFGIDEGADYDARNIHAGNGYFTFDIHTPQEVVKNIKISMPGRHNVLNTVAAFAMANIFGLKSDEIIKAISSFRGVKRRFSYAIKTENLVVIDDYAHHPTELDVAIDAAKEMYPNKKILGVFQPHLFSRTQDFADDFAKSLEKVDELILLDIYPARELPIAGITSKWLLDKVEHNNKQVLSKEKTLNYIENSDAEVILMLGAGDIGEMVKDVKKIKSVE